MQITPWRRQTPAGFYLIWSRNASLTADAEVVRDWIIETAEASNYPAVDGP